MDRTSPSRARIGVQCPSRVVTRQPPGRGKGRVRWRPTGEAMGYGMIVWQGGEEAAAAPEELAAFQDEMAAAAALAGALRSIRS